LLFFDRGTKKIQQSIQCPVPSQTFCVDADGTALCHSCNHEVPGVGQTDPQPWKAKACVHLRPDPGFAGKTPPPGRDVYARRQQAPHEGVCGNEFEPPAGVEETAGAGLLSIIKHSVKTFIALLRNVIHLKPTRLHAR
jgi:hypothetical protein